MEDNDNPTEQASNSNPTVNVELFSAVLDSKFDKLKRELSEESSSQLNSAVKRARLTKVFKKKGCQRQYEHNEEVREKLEEVSKSIDGGKLQKAKDILTEGIDFIDKRQKVIKIADCHGWDTVNAYLSDELADDSEDDKRLSKAVRHAEYKRREKERLNRKKRNSARGRYNFRSSSSATVSTQDPVTKPMFQRSTTRFSPLYQTCWSCGQSGHRQYQCPQRVGVQQQGSGSGKV